MKELTEGDILIVGGLIEMAKQEERARWLPLWEALNKFDSYYDFDTPIDDGKGFEDAGGINEARVGLYNAICNLRNQGEK